MVLTSVAAAAELAPGPSVSASASRLLLLEVGVAFLAASVSPASVLPSPLPAAAAALVGKVSEQAATKSLLLSYRVAGPWLLVQERELELEQGGGEGTVASLTACAIWTDEKGVGLCESEVDGSEVDKDTGIGAGSSNDRGFVCDSGAQLTSAFFLAGVGAGIRGSGESIALLVFAWGGTS